MKSRCLTFLAMILSIWIMPEILLAQCQSGLEVMTRAGESEVEVCLGSNNTTVRMRPGTDAGPYAFAITDEQNVILNVSLKNKIDFAEAPAGVCRIYGISWWGTFNPSIGETIDAAEFTDFCYFVSPNYVTVTRSLLGQGTVQTDAGVETVYTCPGDGIADLVNFTYEGTSNGDFTYIITDEDYNILGIPEGDSQDFEGAGEGICLVWGLNFQGDLLAVPGANALTDQLASGCYGLSSNSIRVIRSIPEAGTIETNLGSTEVDVCVGDGVADEIIFQGMGQSAAAFRIVITNADNEIVGLPDGNAVDFDGAGAGICRAWGISFTGSLQLLPGQDITQSNISDGCNDLSSNFVEITRTYINGGSVSMPSGETKTYTCTQDDQADLVLFEHDSSSESSYVYIITSPELEILGIEPNDGHDFNDAPPGTCWVWGLAYTGNLTAEVGQNAGEVALSSGCFDLSDNYIEVIRDVPNGGVVSMPSGATERYTCTQDDSADIVSFQHEGSSNSKYIYIITSPELEILGIEPNDSHDFNDAPPGTCWVWGLAYTGNLLANVGDNAGEIALSDDCFDLSDNFIKVIRDVPDGGSVSTPAGLDTVFTCTQDGNADFVSFSHEGASNSKYVYIITSPTLEILGIEENDGHDFDDAPPGTCWVWGLAYTGNLIAQVGQNAGEAVLSDDCFDLSDNFISVIRDAPEGGTVSTPEGQNSVMTCTQDGNPDVVLFDHQGTNSNYAYIITSPDLEILGIEFNNSHDFDDAPPGTCWVWGLSYTGFITAQIGQNASEVPLSSDCYDLSDNFIEVIREVPDGGSVMMPSGATRRYTCTQDGMPDVVQFEAKDVVGPNYVYIITSPDLEILGVEPEDQHDFDDAPPGTCWVWGMAYTGNLTAMVGDNAGEVALSDECFDLSDNYIEIIRDTVNGGLVQMPSGQTKTYTCTQDGTSDIVVFENMGASNSKYIYIITSPTLEILGIEENDSHDFDDAPPGTCWVWGLAYTGNFTAQVGDNAGEVVFTDDCFDLSDNYIEVVRDQPDGGSIAMPSGATKVYTCTQDSTADEVMFVTEGASNSRFVYIITSPTLEILGIEENESHDFDDAPPGTCWVWGLAYTGNLTAMVGDDAGEVALSDGCFDLSDNFIEVIRDMPNGGRVSTSDGDTAVSVVTGDGVSDVIFFSHQGNSNSVYTYVITDDSNQVLGLPPANSNDFEPAGVGVCRVWGLAYTGNLLVQVGDNIATADLSDDCYDLSDNFIEVTRTSAGEGQLDASLSHNIPLQVDNPKVSVVNPTQGFIRGTIETFRGDNLGLKLYDYQGRLVKSRDLQEQNRMLRLDWDVTDLAPGIYILSVFHKHGRESKKLVLQ